VRSYSVTCHPIQVNAPRLNLSQTGLCLPAIYREQKINEHICLHQSQEFSNKMCKLIYTENTMQDMVLFETHFRDTTIRWPRCKSRPSSIHPPPEFWWTSSRRLYTDYLAINCRSGCDTCWPILPVGFHHVVGVAFRLRSICISARFQSALPFRWRIGHQLAIIIKQRMHACFNGMGRWLKNVEQQ